MQTYHTVSQLKNYLDNFNPDLPIFIDDGNDLAVNFVTAYFGTTDSLGTCINPHTDSSKNLSDIQPCIILFPRKTGS